MSQIPFTPQVHAEVNRDPISTQTRAGLLGPPPPLAWVQTPRVETAGGRGVLPRLVWELGLTYWSLLHSTMHFRMDTRHSRPFFLRVSSYGPQRKHVTNPRKTFPPLAVRPDLPHDLVCV